MSLLLLLGGAGSGTSTATGVAGPAGTTMIVEFSPTTGPGETPVWVDITTKVRFASGVDINRGRSSELDDFVAGRCKLVLDNRARLFDPNYSAGTYYGNLKPLRPFRISVRYAGVTYTRFYGFIVGWPQGYDRSKREAVVHVELVDAFGLFVLANMTESLFTLDSATLGVLDQNRLGGGDSVIGSELSGARIDRVLDLVGWPDTLRDLDTGNSLMNSTQPSGAALTYLKNVERSEDGFFFISRDGKASFLQRSSRYTEARMVTSQATFSDDGADNRYAAIGFDYDLDRVYNDARRTRDGGTEQAAEDTTSITSYFRRSHSETGLLLTSDAECLDRAAGFVDRYAEPATRVPGVTVKPLRDPTVIFPAWLPRELLDRITVETTPMNLGSQYATSQLIEGYTERFNTKTYEVELRTSNTYDPAVLVLDDATKGVLDSRVLAS